MNNCQLINLPSSVQIHRYFKVGGHAFNCLSYPLYKAHWWMVSALDVRLGDLGLNVTSRMQIKSLNP
jgi:hypothetical protein